MNGSLPLQYDTYCIRCGKLLHNSESYFSSNDPDHEESLCRDCWKRLELSKIKKVESEEL